MCGIVFGITNSEDGFDYDDVKVFNNLFQADVVRGSDGAGLYWLDAEDKLFYSRNTGHVGTNYNLSGLSDWIGGGRFVVGHNRAATIGAVSKETTHPFTFSNVTGVHNGTISGWKQLGAKDATMDSMAVYEVLDDTDPDDEAVGNFLGQIDLGAYALVWYDARVRELRMARNNQRPLHLAVTNTGMLWGASELRMLEWVLDRNKYRISKSFSLATYSLLCIPVDGGKSRAYDYSDSLKVGGWSSGWDSPGYQSDWWTRTQQQNKAYYETQWKEVGNE